MLDFYFKFMNYDKVLIKIFFIDDWHFNKSNLEKYKTHYKKKDKYKNVIEYIENRYTDSLSFKETLYRIKNNIDKRPVCKECGKPVEFVGKSPILFRVFCCNKCSANNKDTIKKKWESDLKNHNGKIGWIESNKSKDKINNRKKTLIDKFGSLENANKEIYERVKETKLKKYGNPNYTNYEKVHKTKLERYGDPNYRNPIKCAITKKENNTFNKSKWEDESYDLLKEKYPDIIRQYISEKYPFNCDFYIPSSDLYIECNYFWTHGKHPYSELNINDLNKIEFWKSKNTRFYDNAIENWTIRDINKRKIAKENNLNWIEFFNINELKEWLAKN